MCCCCALSLNLDKALWHERISGNKQQVVSTRQLFQHCPSSAWAAYCSGLLPALWQGSTRETGRQSRVELKRSLLQLAEGIPSDWAEHGAHSGLAPALPFPLNSYISVWKNNFTWQNTVYGKWARFSWWFRCHRDYEVKALVLKGCGLSTEITRNIMLWDLTFIHSVHQVLMCT